MGVKTIPLSQFEADPAGVMAECTERGQAFVVELPNHRFVAIHSLQPGDDDPLGNELLETNDAFRRLLARSEASPRKPFAPGGRE